MNHTIVAKKIGFDTQKEKPELMTYYIPISEIKYISEKKGEFVQIHFKPSFFEISKSYSEKPYYLQSESPNEFEIITKKIDEQTKTT